MAKNEEYTPDNGFDVDGFNLEEDWKPEPLIPAMTYRGSVVEISTDFSKGRVTFMVCLQDNGGVKTDGETPIDGSRIGYNVWLPMPADKALTTASGKNKWQNKVNMLRDFSQSMAIDMNTPAQIQEAIDGAEWIGLSVQCTIAPDEYNGQVRDAIKLGTLVVDRD